jgi:hypothetical protein
VADAVSVSLRGSGAKTVVNVDLLAGFAPDYFLVKQQPIISRLGWQS